MNLQVLLMEEIGQTDGALLWYKVTEEYMLKFKEQRMREFTSFQSNPDARNLSINQWLWQSHKAANELSQTDLEKTTKFLNILELSVTSNQQPDEIPTTSIDMINLELQRIRKLNNNQKSSALQIKKLHNFFLKTCNFRLLFLSSNRRLRNLLDHNHIVRILNIVYIF